MSHNFKSKFAVIYNFRSTFEFQALQDALRVGRQPELEGHRSRRTIPRDPASKLLANRQRVPHLSDMGGRPLHWHPALVQRGQLVHGQVSHQAASARLHQLLRRRQATRQPERAVDGSARSIASAAMLVVSHAREVT